jgi:RNA polymerase sigma factor (sigma-70 family)
MNAGGVYGRPRREIGVMGECDLGDLADWAHVHLGYLLNRFGIPEHERDDILQDALLALYTRSDVKRPHAYLCATVTNRCKSYHRRRSIRAEESLEELEIDVAIDPGQPLVALLADLDRCQSRLTGSERELLKLKLEQGLSNQEIAERLERSPAAIRSAWNRCVERVRRILKDLQPA